MTNIANLLTEHMAIWTAADTEKKSGRGRASSNAGSVYGVKKLRELIFTLAITGKLLPQNPNDEPALENIKITKLWGVKGDQFLNKNHELPGSWILVPMEMLAAEVDYPIGDGDHGKIKPSCYSNTGIPYIRVADLGWGSFEPNGLVHIPESVHMQNLKSELRPDDILIAKTGATIGKCCIVPSTIPRANTTSSVGKVTVNQTVVTPKWILSFFLSSAFKEKMWSVSIKTAQPGFNILDLKKFKVPIPPLTEQHRIIAKVDELMTLCDQLEQQHSNAQEAHETLVSQLLAMLTQSQNAAEFNTNWQRINAHFDVLFTTEASIDALKQTLLQLAVMGKLVPQDPNDEPASELLKRIQAEKAKLIAEGKLKKDKPLAPICEDEKPFELPRGWEWSKVLDCSVFVTDGEHATPQRTSDGKIPLVTAKNVRDGYMDYEDTDFVDISVAEKCWKRCKPEQSDLLMVSVGATLGRLTILEEARDMVIVRSVTLIRPCLLSPLYLSLAIKSPLVQEAIWGSVRQMAQPGLYLAQSSNLVIPIAPLAEQHRIVAKVDALMALCDQLKTHIQQANQQQQVIADALVAQAVA